VFVKYFRKDQLKCSVQGCAARLELAGGEKADKYGWIFLRGNSYCSACALPVLVERVEDLGDELGAARRQIEDLERNGRRE